MFSKKPTNSRAARRALCSLLAVAAGTAASISAAPSALAASKASTKEAPPSGHIAISETGSTLLYPLFQLWSTAYHQRYKNVTVTPQGTGSGVGISSAAGGTADIGASDAYLSNTQVAQYKGLKNIALAISAQQVNYNVSGVPANTHLKLDGKVLSLIYQGKITSWDDAQIKALNPGVKLPNEKIVALHRSDSSGDTFLFTSYLSDQDPSGWGASIGYSTSVSFPAIPNALAEEGNGGMVSGCKATPGCVAYIGISYLTATQQAHLGEAFLQNRAGKFVQPTSKTIVAEAAAMEKKTPANEALSMIDDSAPNGYPIINYEYAILPGREANSRQAAAVRAFLYWAIDRNGGSEPRFLNAVRFQPLPPAVAELSARQIAQIR